MQKKSIAIILLAWIIAGFLFIFYAPKFSSSRDSANYIILIISYFYVPIVYFGFAIRRNIDLFEPINMFFLLWFFMYTITPIILILQDNTLCHGVDVMDGCFKATVIYMVCFTVLCISYFFGFKVSGKRDFAEHNVEQVYQLDVKEFSQSQLCNITIIAMLGWMCCYFISLYYLKATGRGLSYILTLGLLGSKTEASELSLGFLENFSYCMIGFWLYICLASRSKLLKTILAFLTATAYMIRGFRFVVVIMVAAYIIMHFAKENRRPKIRQLIFLLLIMLVFIGFMGFIRNDLRTGDSMDISGFGIDAITYALYSNFNIYQIYYGLVNSLPTKHSFGGFQIALENLAVFIPRIIWPSKPLAIDHLSIKLIVISVSEYAIYHAVMATPDLGSYYMQFGTIGCIAYMLAWGKLCRWVKNLFYDRSYNMHVLIGFSIFVPSLLQTIIRGGELFNIIKKIGFFFIPILCMKLVEQFGWFKMETN